MALDNLFGTEANAALRLRPNFIHRTDGDCVSLPND